MATCIRVRSPTLLARLGMGPCPHSIVAAPRRAGRTGSGAAETRPRQRVVLATAGGRESGKRFDRRFRAPPDNGSPPARLTRLAGPSRDQRPARDEAAGIIGLGTFSGASRGPARAGVRRRTGETRYLPGRTRHWPTAAEQCARRGLRAAAPAKRPLPPSIDGGLREDAVVTANEPGMQRDSRRLRSRRNSGRSRDIG